MTTRYSKRWEDKGSLSGTTRFRTCPLCSTNTPIGRKTMWRGRSAEAVIRPLGACLRIYVHLMLPRQSKREYRARPSLQASSRKTIMSSMSCSRVTEACFQHSNGSMIHLKTSQLANPRWGRLMWTCSKVATARLRSIQPRSKKRWDMSIHSWGATKSSPVISSWLKTRTIWLQMRRWGLDGLKSPSISSEISFIQDLRDQSLSFLRAKWKK